MTALAAMNTSVSDTNSSKKIPSSEEANQKLKEVKEKAELLTNQANEAVKKAELLKRQADVKKAEE